MAVLKVIIVDFSMLIGAEGGEDSSKMLSHFLRAWADSRMQIQSPAGVRGRGDPAGAKRRGGSPARPRKAKCLERKSTDKFNTVYLNTLSLKLGL